MKLIVAIIQPEYLLDVKQELFKADVCKMSVLNVVGAGQQRGYEESYRGVISQVNLLKKVRLEIAVNDSYVEPTIAAITKGAYTGNIGDGKIFVLPLEECIRIRTAERGSIAIG